jgi:carboxypeptidase C (cathepsin A)
VNLTSRIRKIGLATNFYHRKVGDASIRSVAVGLTRRFLRWLWNADVRVYGDTDSMAEGDGNSTLGKDEPKKIYAIDPEGEPVVTEQVLGDLKYSATVGMLPVKDAYGETKAGIFFTAYTVDSPEPRPLTFSFNGGPGSSSVWLHLGALGPKRVKLGDDGEALDAPYDLVDNSESWLSFTDLVFIDPVGTGFSRSLKAEDEESFWGLSGDVDSIADFIRSYLTRFERWMSPLYIAGESYGTTRAAGLSDALMDRGIGLKALVLISSILNFQTARFNRGNDLPFLLFLPTYAATAHFHGKLSKDLQAKPLEELLVEVEEFCESEYLLALNKGSSLSPEKTAETVEKLARFTGLDPLYIELTGLRINIHRFCKELLRKEGRTVGRLDSRYKGIDPIGVSESPEFDPSTVIGPAFTHCLNDYIQRELGYRSKLPYYISNPDKLWARWKWGDAGGGYPDTSEALRRTMSKNKFMRVFIANGYYDLATPYFATRYTLNHMALDPSLLGNITNGYYESGHMMYVHSKELANLKRDVEAFYAD